MRVTTKKEKKTVKGCTTGRMALSSWGSGVSIKSQGTAPTRGLMVGSMKGSGWRTTCMGRACTLGKMVGDMRASIC